MVSWDKTKGSVNTGGNQERREIKRLVLQNGDNKVRLVGEVLPRYVYWVTTKEGKKYPVECLSFDRQREIFDNSMKDPIKEINEEIYSEKPQFAYVCNIINRKDSMVNIFDLRSTIYKQVVDYAVNPDYGNPADETTGYDLNIKKEKTGPLAQNVKYTIIPARNSTALSEADKSLELYELDKIFKRPTYEEQKKWLLENTTYFEGADDVDLRPQEKENDLD